MNAFQRAVVRAINGTMQIGSTCWRWPWQHAGFWPRVVRLFWLAFGCWSLYALSAVWPWVGAAAIAVLLVLGYWQALPVEAEAEPTEDDPEPELGPSSEQQVLAMVLDFLGDDTAIHLDTLLDRFREHPAGTDMTRDDLRRLLADVGCPIRRAVRVGTRTGVAGVHRDDAQTALDALAEDATPLPPPGTPPDL